MFGQLVTHTHFTAHDGGVNVIGLADTGVMRIVFEQDKVIHMANISRYPAVKPLIGILSTDIDLRGFFTLHAVKRTLVAARPKCRGEQLPIVGETLGIADPCVQHQRHAGQCVLNTAKTARQRIGTLSIVASFVVIHQGTIETSTADDLALFGRAPGQFTKGTIVMELRILLPGVTPFVAMRVGLRIHTAFQLKILPQPGTHHSTADGATIQLHGHAGVHRHPHAHVSHRHAALAG